jgi:signal transduction histidine kinase
MCRRLLLLTALVLVAAATHPFAQPPEARQLYNKLLSAREDTDRVNIYYKLSHYYWSSNADSALLLGQKGLDLATRIHFEKGMALCYLSRGVAYEMQGLYPEALNSDLQALRLSEKLGMDGLSGNNYSNISIVYADMADYPKAIDYERRALQSAQKYHAQNGVAYAYINIGDIYARDKQYDSAISYNRQALAIGETIHDTTALANALEDLGQDYNSLGQPQQALPPLQRALRIAELAHDDAAAASDHMSLADAYYRLGQYPTSIEQAGLALKSAQAIHSSDIAKQSYHLLYTSHQAIGDCKNALYYRNQEIALSDSLYDLAKEKQLRTLETDYELEQKQHQIDLLNKDKEIRARELDRERISRYLLIGGALLLALWVFFLVYTNRQKQKQNRKLEELNAIKNKLLSIIGHDLRTPVGTLKGFVDLLKNSAITPAQISYFSGKMSESLESTYYLLENLLHWAKSQMDGMQANSRQLDLGAIIQRNKDLAQNRASAKEITLITEGVKPPPPLYADEVMIDMVIRNLVENALKFSRPGDTVTISAEGAGADTIITVRDTGVGIPPEAQAKLFTGGLSQTTLGTSKERGSGLGLALCKELVEKNGGTIRFTSEPGKGTSFIISLPAAP